MFKFIRKTIFPLCILIIIVSCNVKTTNEVKISDKKDYITYDFSFTGNEYIIVPKNQTDGQSLSIIIKDSNDDLIIFDGGRVEDADFLTSIISSFGGKVKAWFLTHIHDDHIGALYNILKDKKIDIDMIYYDFLDFDWYYDKISDDAGIMLLFKDVLDEYSKTKNVNIVDSFHDTYDFDSFRVNILNSAYKCESDPINNTSIVYKVIWKDASMIILGDLGYEGGERLINDNAENILKSDIVVMAHHGQNGVYDDVYKKISPFIAIWPTSKDVYENINGNFKTDETKKWLYDIGVRYNILSYEHTSIIK